MHLCREWQLVWSNSTRNLWSVDLRQIRVSHHQHSPAVDLPGFEVREHLVDIIELGLVDLSFHLALCCEGNGFCEVLAAAHDGAANRYAVEHHIEDGRLKFSRRKTAEADGALAPHP